MGRYYSGDIEGKFWFGIQPSNDAEQFGAVIDAEGWEEDREPIDGDLVPYIAFDVKMCERRCREIFRELKIEPRMDFEDAAGIRSFIDSIWRTHGRGDHAKSLIASLGLGLEMYLAMNELGTIQFDTEW